MKPYPLPADESSARHQGVPSDLSQSKHAGPPALGDRAREDEVPRTSTAWMRLLAEAQQALETGPPIASLFHDEIADAHWSYLASIGERSRTTAVRLGIDVDRRFKLGNGEFSWDFAIEPHRVIEARYQAGVAHLASQGLFLPMWDTPAALAAGGFALPGWLVKLLAVFGVEPEDLSDVADTFSEEIGDDLLEDLKRAFSEAFEDAAQGKWEAAENKLATALKKLQEFLERLVDRIEDFVVKLIERMVRRLGAERALAKAAAIGRNIASKALPGIGVCMTILQLLWLMMRNIKIAYV